MSKLSEYLALIPKALPNSKEIIIGIMKAVELKYNLLPEDEKSEIVKRRIICKECPFNSNNAKISEEYFILMGKNYDTDREDEHCSFCGCGLNTRTSSLTSNCGIETWNDNNPTKKLSLKWRSYAK